MLVPKRLEQQVDVIGHGDHGVEVDPTVGLAETVCEDQIAGMLRQKGSGSGTESDKKRCIVFLQMWQTASIAIFGGGWAGHLLVWGARPRAPMLTP
jgi:hypothetical protein